MAWVQKPSGLIKSGGKRKRFLREAILIKVENVSMKQISTINVYHYQICPTC
jgi:hypothetical protein